MHMQEHPPARTMDKAHADSALAQLRMRAHPSPAGAEARPARLNVKHHRAYLEPEGRLPQHHVAPCTPPPGALCAAAAQQVCAAHGRLTQGSGRHLSQLW